jgi:hypothetical protein
VAVSWSIDGVSKSKKRIVKTQSPIGSIKTSVEERAVTPKGVVKGIVEAPIEIKIPPRVVVDVIDFSFTGAIPPWGLGIYSYTVVIVIATVVISICIGIFLGIVQSGVIIGNIAEIIFVINFIFVGFLYFSFFSGCKSIPINTI